MPSIHQEAYWYLYMIGVRPAVSTEVNFIAFFPRLVKRQIIFCNDIEGIFLVEKCTNKIVLLRNIFIYIKKKNKKGSSLVRRQDTLRVCSSRQLIAYPFAKFAYWQTADVGNTLSRYQRKTFPTITSGSNTFEQRGKLISEAEKSNRTLILLLRVLQTWRTCNSLIGKRT